MMIYVITLSIDEAGNAAERWLPAGRSPGILAGSLQTNPLDFPVFLPVIRRPVADTGTSESLKGAPNLIGPVALSSDEHELVFSAATSSLCKKVIDFNWIDN
jgi:hypothetical protein